MCRLENDCSASRRYIIRIIAFAKCFRLGIKKMCEGVEQLN